MGYGTNFISTTTIAGSTATDMIDAVSGGAASKILAPIDYTLKANDIIGIIGGIAKTAVVQWQGFLITLDDMIAQYSGSYASVKDIVDESLWGKSTLNATLNYNNRARFVIEQYVYYALRERGTFPSDIDMSGTFRKVLYAEDGLFSRSYRAEYYKR